MSPPSSSASSTSFGWRDMLALGVLVTAIVVLARRFWFFTLDDAYITLRFSQNLAAGHGLVWNPGGVPTEGYTTTLWVLLMAIPHLFGVTAISVAKVLGAASLAGTVVLLYAWGRSRGVHRGVLTAILACLALSPAVVVLAVQGMETATAMLLVAGASLASVIYVRDASTQALATLLGLNVLLVLIRPGLAIFAGALVAAVTAVEWGRGRREKARRFFAAAFVANGVPAAAYVGLRWWYFGELKTNAMFVKSSSQVISPTSIEHLYFLVVALLGPSLVLGFAGALGRWSEIDEAELWGLVPMLVAGGTFFAALLPVIPIQAFFSRFHAPAAPVLLIVAIVLAARIDPPSLDPGSFEVTELEPVLRRGVALALLGLVLVAPMQTLTDAEAITAQKAPGDRVAAGEALSVFQGSSHRMWVTESGALPYLSGWRSVDDLGLTNTSVAKRGATVEAIEALDPHLIQSRLDNPITEAHPAQARYLDDSSYRLAAAIEKTGPRDLLHVYFVDTSKPDARAITCALLTLSSVDHANRAEVADRLQFEADPAPWDRSGCEGG